MTEISRIWSGTSIGDAGPYSDADWRELWESVTKNALNSSFNSIGYVAGTGSTTTSQPLKVTESTPNALSVDVAVGIAWFFGAYYENDAVETLAISTNLSGNPRIDALCLTMDWTAQEIRLEVVDGTPAGSPVAPTLTQTKGTLWQHKLAEVTVANGAISITNANIDQTFNVPIQINDETLREVTTGDAISTFNANWDGTLLDTPALAVVNWDDDSNIFFSPNNGDVWYPNHGAYAVMDKGTSSRATSSTSLVAMSGMSVSFTPLKSGTALVHMAGNVEGGGGNQTRFDININGTNYFFTTLSYSLSIQRTNSRSAYSEPSNVGGSFYITGLTPGTTYTMALYWAVNTGTTNISASDAFRVLIHEVL